MSTKIQIVNGAYSQLRISGLTVIPSPSDISLALSRLEDMMAELYSVWGLNINYNFEDTPNPNSQTNVARNFNQMMFTNLATRLVPDFGKELPQTLAGQASQSISNAIGIVAQENMRQIQPPRRMPRGSGNTFRGVFWNRYSTPEVLAPVSPATNTILQGETLNYYEDFSAFLGSATISSFTIDADPLLTIDTSANATPRITYTITAPVQNTNVYGPFQQVMITITDSLNRTEIRLINFNVLTPPAVGS